MSAGTHPTANNAAKPRQRLFWIFGGAATAVIVGGILMQYFRAPASQAATNTAGTARVGNPQRTMAKVGNEVITFEAVADECVARYGREVLDDLIHRTIITKACETQNITVSDVEVTQEIQRIAGRFKLDAGAYLQMLQSERNITESQYRRSVIWPMLALRKLAGETVEISEEDMQKAFVRNYGPRVKARVIVLEGGTARQHDDVWQDAKSDPENFDKLAQEKSVDPNSRALGGLVPPIPRNAGNDTLEKEAFKLKAGEISGLIEIATGRFVILKCEGRTDPVVTDIEEVRDTLYDELKEGKTQQAVAKVFEKIKDKTPVENIYAGAPVTRGAPVQANTQGAASTTGTQPASAQPRTSRPANVPATTTAPVRSTRN